MAIHVKNMKELNKALQPVMKGMVDKMAERVEQTLNYFLQEYYNSYNPKSIVVSVSVTALMLSLTIRLYRKYHTLDMDEISTMLKKEDE